MLGRGGVSPRRGCLFREIEVLAAGIGAVGVVNEEVKLVTLKMAGILRYCQDMVELT